MLSFYNLDGSAWAPSAGTFEAGATSEPISLELWQGRGGGETEPAREVLVWLETWDGVDTVWRRDALAPQVELWVQLRAVGQVATDPEQRPFTSDWIGVGFGSALALPPIYPDCGRRLELRVRLPSTAEARSWEWRLVAESNVHWAPAAEIEAGVLAGYDGRSGLLRGGQFAATEPATAELGVAPRLVVVGGEPLGFEGETVELDQFDGATQPLAAGEAYLAVIGQAPGALVVTKGLRAAIPLQPGLPEGALYLGLVRVDHTGGASLIEAEDVLDVAEPLRLQPRAGVGLELVIGSGEALAGGTRRYWSEPARVALPDDAETTVWQLPSGLYALERAAGALPIAHVTTAGGEVTALQDLRRFAGRWMHIQLGPRSTVGVLGTWVCPVAQAILDRVRIAVVGFGGTGRAQIDVRVNGTTIYGDGGLPEVADVAVAIADGGVPTGQLVLAEGDLVTAHLLELPTGGAEVLALVAVVEA